MIRIADEATSMNRSAATQRVSLEPPNETTGASRPSWYPQPLAISRITAPARRIAGSLETDSMAAALGRVAQDIEEMATAMAAYGMDVSTLPPINAEIAEDGAASLEWLLPDMRIGFTVEPDVSKSGWFLVSSSRLGEGAASGFLSEVGRSELFLRLLSILRANT